MKSIEISNSDKLSFPFKDRFRNSEPLANIVDPKTYAARGEWTDADRISGDQDRIQNCYGKDLGGPVALVWLLLPIGIKSSSHCYHRHGVMVMFVSAGK